MNFEEWFGKTIVLDGEGPIRFAKRSWVESEEQTLRRVGAALKEVSDFLDVANLIATRESKELTNMVRDLYETKLKELGVIKQ